VSWLLRFVPTFAPALKVLANPWVLLVAALAVAAIYGMGLKTGIDWEQGKQAALDLERERQWTAYLRDFFARQDENNRVVAGRLAGDRARLAADRAKFREERDAANSQGPVIKARCPKPRQQPQPQRGAEARPVAPAVPAEAAPGGDAADGVVCDDACIRLWNSAVSVGLSEAERRQFADAASAVAGPLGERAFFANVEENAARCSVARSIARGWQMKACLEGWWTGAECKDLVP